MDYHYPEKDKPYLVTFEVRANNIEEALKFAQEICGVHAVESVTQKYRMTNVGTEWHKTNLV